MSMSSLGELIDQSRHFWINICPWFPRTIDGGFWKGARKLAIIRKLQKAYFHNGITRIFMKFYVI